jgi:hypothetical protein
MTDKAPHVYLAIAEIAGKLAKEGIAKNRKNEQGSGYKFRGIDDVYNALASLLAEHKLVILPRVTSREITERTSKSGGALFYIVLNVEFDFISAIDGSKHTVVTMGEAMDSGDKATNKAMSAAYKYAALLTFCIPTEGDNDTENQTHEVSPKKETKSKSDDNKPLKKEKTPQQIKIAGWIDELEKLNEISDVTYFTQKINPELKDLSVEQLQYLNKKLKERSIELSPIGA